MLLYILYMVLHVIICVFICCYMCFYMFYMFLYVVLIFVLRVFYICLAMFLYVPWSAYGPVCVQGHSRGASQSPEHIWIFLISPIWGGPHPKESIPWRGDRTWDRAIVLQTKHPRCQHSIILDFYFQWAPEPLGLDWVSSPRWVYMCSCTRVFIGSAEVLAHS